MNEFYLPATEANRHLIKSFTYASCAAPVAFPPLIHQDCHYWDGGIREPIPAMKAIDECSDYDYLFLLLAVPLNAQPMPHIGPTIFSHSLRFLDVMYYSMLRKSIRLAFQRGKKNRVILFEPDQRMFEYSLDFGHDGIMRGIEHGYNVAKRICKKYGI